MDPVTHFLTGACLGRAGLNRVTGLATLTLTLATEAPDLDVLAYFAGPVAGFKHHRGFTHSLLGAPIMAAVVVAGVYGIYRLMLKRGRHPKLPPNWKWLYVFALLGQLVHLLQDFTNNYGIRPFAPFSPRWYSWDIVFIVDPLMLLALFLALVLPGLFSLVTEEIGSRKSESRGRPTAVTAFAFLVALILLRDFEHRRAVNALNARTYHDQQPLRVSAFPGPLNMFAWNGVVETENSYVLLPADTWNEELDPQNTATVRYKPEETPVTLTAKRSALGQVFLDWADYPLASAESLEGGRWRVELMDLRFTRASDLRAGRKPLLAAYFVVGRDFKLESMQMGGPPPD